MTKQRSTGFTIVELLIVIVVIAILAAITIVAYNGIQERARISSVSSALSQTNKKLALYLIENNNQYPADLGTVGINNGSDISYQYTVDNNTNPATYCVTATTGSTSYKASSTTATPTSGGCAGHGQGGVAAITNLHTNPSAETNTAGYSGANGTTLTRTAGAALAGSYGIRASAAANGTADSGINLGIPAGVAGQTRTYSVKIRAQTADTYRFSLQGVQFVGTVSTVSLAAGQTATLTYTHNITTSGAIALYILRSNSTAVVDFDVDAVMVTTGPTTYTYADGNSANWTWNGTPANNTTSTGPPL